MRGAVSVRAAGGWVGHQPQWREAARQPRQNVLSLMATPPGKRRPKVEISVKLLAELRRRNVFRLALAYIVTAWVVVESSSLLLGIFNAPAWVAQAIVVLLAAGFPVALVFAWMFEITPEGIKHDRDVTPGSRESLASGRYLVLVTIVMAMLAVGLFVVDRFLLDSGAGTGVAGREDALPVIAVMPFEVVGSSDGAALADGLHHDLLTRMSKLHAFAVISRTSMLEYRDTTKNIREIGAELGADYILEGGVQLAGQRVRINAQLIDAGIDEHLWADTYDRELTAMDLFAIQSDLAIDIADQLELTLSPKDREQAAEIPTENTEAYTAYLRSLAALDNPDLADDERVELAYAEIKKAVALDPAFVDAWTQLVRYSGMFGIWTGNVDMRADVTAALETVKRLAPGSYDAAIAEVYYMYYVDADYAEVVPAIARLEERGALGADALYMRGKALRRVGRLQDAYDAYVASARLNPRSTETIADLLMTSMLLGNCRRAGLHASALLALTPDDGGNRAQAANYELRCNLDATRAADLVRGFEAKSDAALWAARDAAAIRHDLESLLKLFELHGSNSFWAGRAHEKMVYARLLRMTGRAAEADGELAAAAQILASADPGDSETIQFAYRALQVRLTAQSGDLQAARQLNTEVARTLETADWDPVTRASMLAALAFWYSSAGLADEAIDVLDRLFAGPTDLTFRYVDAHLAFDALRDHPRYAKLRRKYGDRDDGGREPQARD